MEAQNTYQQKFQQLALWMPSLIQLVKKDLRQEHLKKDVAFVRQYFQTKNPAKISIEEMIEVYPKVVMAGNEALGEYIATRWLLKHPELYQFFETELSRIHPNFAELIEIEPAVAQGLMQKAVETFGAVDTYLFSILNSVVFPPAVFQKLAALAQQQAVQQAADEASKSQRQAEAQSQRDLTLSIARLTDRYEKKLQGLERKYLQDTETLKRQVAQLQRKLADVTQGAASGVQ